VRRVLLLLLAVALLVPGSARANGDPASDVLLTQQVFLPFEAPISTSAKSDLQKTVAAANSKGYTIRVAIIAFTGDLGTAVSLWQRPQPYAKFLWSELSFQYANRLLVAMPNGFGFYNGPRSIDKELTVLRKMKAGQIPTDLTESAGEAVRALAAANGVKLPKPSSGGSATRDRLIILGVSLVALVAVLLFPAKRLRRRAQGAEQ
jgi:hypothetical protein